MLISHKKSAYTRQKLTHSHGRCRRACKPSDFICDRREQNDRACLRVMRISAQGSDPARGVDHHIDRHDQYSQADNAACDACHE